LSTLAVARIVGFIGYIAINPTTADGVSYVSTK
jgi:hypothetical protein